MDVSVIIVNYNTEELTLACVQSVIEHTTGVDYEILVVDNCSPNGPPTSVEQYDQVRLIRSNENGGFAKGNNLGVEQAKGDYILLLNSDTELRNNALNISKSLMDENPTWGLLGGQLINPGDRIQKSTRRFRTITWELMELFPIHLFLSKRKREEMMLHHYFDHKRFVEVDWLSGAYMFFRREVITAFPNHKLAEDYFMYCEDVLWCWQAKELGWKVVFHPEPKIFHHHHGTVEREKSLKIRKAVMDNHLDFVRRYFYRDWKYFIFKPIFLIKQTVISWIE